MKVEDYDPQGKRWWLRLHEKGGKRHDVPAHHSLEQYLDAYCDAAGMWDDKKGSPSSARWPPLRWLRYKKPSPARRWSRSYDTDLPGGAPEGAPSCDDGKAPGLQFAGVGRN